MEVNVLFASMWVKN